MDEMRREAKSNNLDNMISHVVEPRTFSSEYPDNDLMVQTSRHLTEDSMNPKAIMQTPKLAPSTKIRLIGTKYIRNPSEHREVIDKSLKI